MHLHNAFISFIGVNLAIGMIHCLSFCSYIALNYNARIQLPSLICHHLGKKLCSSPDLGFNCSILLVFPIYNDA